MGHRVKGYDIDTGAIDNRTVFTPPTPADGIEYSKLDVLRNTRTIFVSLNGSDGADGSLYRPYRTVQKAVDELIWGAADDYGIITLLGGHFAEDVVIDSNGYFVIDGLGASRIDSLEIKTASAVADGIRLLDFEIGGDLTIHATSFPLGVGAGVFAENVAVLGSVIAGPCGHLSIVAREENPFGSFSIDSVVSATVRGVATSLSLTVTPAGMTKLGLLVGDHLDFHLEGTFDSLSVAGYAVCKLLSGIVTDLEVVDNSKLYGYGGEITGTITDAITSEIYLSGTTYDIAQTPTQAVFGRNLGGHALGFDGSGAGMVSGNVQDGIIEAYNHGGSATAFDDSGEAEILVGDLGVKAVVFAVAQPDATYRILLTGDAIGGLNYNEVSKTVAGFTIEASSFDWVGKVSWAITRKYDDDDKSGIETIGAGDSGTKVVTFATPFSDADYAIFLTGGAIGGFNYNEASKASTGFTIEAASSDWVGKVDWIAKHN